MFLIGDLKPGNLLLVRTISEENLAKMDEKDRYQFFAVKIGDLGFAKGLYNASCFFTL